MKKNFVCLAAILIIFLISCKNGKFEKAIISSDKTRLKLGLITALTGVFSGYGEQVLNGCKLAVEEINKTADIEIELIIEDSAGEPDKALVFLRKLADIDDVSAIIGPLLSEEMMVIGAHANIKKIPMLATSNTIQGIPQLGEYIFRNSMPESLALPESIKKAVEKFQIKNVVLIFQNDDAYTRNTANIFKQAVQDLNLNMLQVFEFQKEQIDFKKQLTEIKKINADAILCSTFFTEGAYIMKQARALGIKVPFIGGNGFNSPKIIEIADKSADGLIVATPWFIGNKDVKVQKFIKNFQNKYAEIPDQFSAQAYDGVYLIAEAVKTSSSTKRNAIREALSTINNFDGVLGKFSFDADGEVVMTPLVLTVENGAFKLLNLLNF